MTVITGAKPLDVENIACAFPEKRSLGLKSRLPGGTHRPR
jgi:hypothetical protein